MAARHRRTGDLRDVQNSFYVALSAQKALMRRLDTIANNVANVSTGGYRAEEVTFSTVLSEVNQDPVAYVSGGRSYVATRPGEIVRTDNPLDVAVQGNAWLAVQTPAGTVYTRDGRMKLSAQGELQSLNGYPVLDSSGSAIRLESDGGAPIIGTNGTIAQGRRQVGQIGLFTIDPKASFTRFEGSGVIPSSKAEPVVDSTKYGVQQGFVERSNVNPVTEMTRMIALQRTFDAVSAGLKDSESSQQDAIRTLGSNQ